MLNVRNYARNMIWLSKARKNVTYQKLLTKLTVIVIICVILYIVITVITVIIVVKVVKVVIMDIVYSLSLSSSSFE